MDWSSLLSALIVCLTIWLVGAKVCRTICTYLARVINELKNKKNG